MEHKNTTTISWKQEASAFFTAYGYEAVEHDGKLRVYIDGMPCHIWKDEEGYHFSTSDGVEAIEPTWECVSALMLHYIMREYIIEGDRAFHAMMLANECGYGAFFGLFQNFANHYDKPFSARVFANNIIYADCQIGEKSLLFCLFSEKSWNVEIWLSGYHRYMSLDFNSAYDFIDAIKGVVADYFLDK